MNAAARLVHRGLGRVELFDFAAEDLDGIADLLAPLAAEGHRRLSLHSPLPRLPGFAQPGVTCYFLNDDDALREESLHQLGRTIEQAAELGADYVVTHLTYGRTDTRDPDRARALAHTACERIAALARAADMPVHIEFAAYTDAFHDPRDFVAAVTPHAGLGICIDSGHTVLGAALRGRNYHDDVRVLAPHARSLHLWNTRGAADYRERGHVPLHPDQRPADGWIDIEAVLAAVLACNADAAVVFEYPVTVVDEHIVAGYRWVEAMVDRLLEAMQTQTRIP
ncbi:MAG: sugar phosphate isomerase/epimerase [Gammaproteobacteria bacterium]|nr:sugar phosphate isomerase/epimerase [Gammaproteobacteria bacterium]